MKQKNKSKFFETMLGLLFLFPLPTSAKLRLYVHIGLRRKIRFPDCSYVAELLFLRNIKKTFQYLAILKRFYCAAVKKTVAIYRFNKIKSICVVQTKNEIKRSKEFLKIIASYVPTFFWKKETANRAKVREQSHVIARQCLLAFIFYGQTHVLVNR
jgi:hypothetical protein